MNANVVTSFEKGLLFLQWKQAYPRATSYGPPGFAKKLPKVDAVELRDAAPLEWLGEIDLAYLSYERLPFLNKAFFHEVGDSLITDHDH